MLQVELADIKAFEESLYDRFLSSPVQMVSVMEEGVRNYVREKKHEVGEEGDHQWHVTVVSGEEPIGLREISSRTVSRLVVVRGIVISTSKPYIKARRLKIQCKHCTHTQFIDLVPGEEPFIPRMCAGQTGEKCPHDPYHPLPDSEVIDVRTLRLQEILSDLPTGEIARTYQLVADRSNVSKCVPGHRVKVTGVMCLSDMKSQNLSKGYIYVCGIQRVTDRSNSKCTD